MVLGVPSAAAPAPAPFGFGAPPAAAPNPFSGNPFGANPFGAPAATPPAAAPAPPDVPTGPATRAGMFDHLIPCPPGFTVKHDTGRKKK